MQNASRDKIDIDRRPVAIFAGVLMLASAVAFFFVAGFMLAHLMGL